MELFSYYTGAGKFTNHTPGLKEEGFEVVYLRFWTKSNCPVQVRQI